jgi:hypothetical protein
MTPEEIKDNIKQLDFNAYKQIVDIALIHNLPHQVVDQLCDIVNESNMRNFYIGSYSTANNILTNEEFNRIYSEKLIEKVNKYNQKNQKQ